MASSKIKKLCDIIMTWANATFPSQLSITASQIQKKQRLATSPVTPKCQLCDCQSKRQPPITQAGKKKNLPGLEGNLRMEVLD